MSTEAQPSNATFATKDAILAVRDLNHQDVYVEEWELTVRIRELTGTERGLFDKSVTQVTASKDGNFDVQVEAHKLRLSLVALTLVDESNERIFSEDEMHSLGEKSSKVITRLYEISSKLSGLSADSAEESLGESEAVPIEQSS